MFRQEVFQMLWRKSQESSIKQVCRLRNTILLNFKEHISQQEVLHFASLDYSLLVTRTEKCFKLGLQLADLPHELINKVRQEREGLDKRYSV